MFEYKPNVFKIGNSGLFTCNKKYFEKVPLNQIPEKMYRRTHNKFDYYFDFYKVTPIDDSTIEIEVTDKQDKETKFLSLPEPLRRGNRFLNVHIPAKLFREYKKHKYWSIDIYDKTINRFYLTKRTVEEYKETVQLKADIKKRGL